MQIVTRYEWPDAQLCFECKNKGREIGEDNSAICMIACKENTGGYCPQFENIGDVYYE